MKILHTADWHLGAYVGPQCDDPMRRMANTIKCLDVLVETAREEQPDIILIAGDIFHTARVWSDRALVEVRTAIDYISILASYASVAVLYGTPNHDNLEAFKMMEEAFGEDCEKVRFFYSPVLEEVETKSGPIQVAALPGFDKGHFRAQFPGLSAEEENQVFSQQLSQIVQGLSAQLVPDIPSVLMAHHTVVGSQLDNGHHIFQGNEVLLDSNTLRNSEFDIVCLGHIHKSQSVQNCSKPVFYAGSIDAFTFNDEDHYKGFLKYKINDKKDISVDFIKTPAREFATINWDQTALQYYITNGFEAFDLSEDPWKDKVVRVLYTCDTEIEKALDKKKLEKDLYAEGAYYVSEIRPEKITAEVNRDRMHEKLTVWDCLKKYLQEKYKDMKDMKDFAPILDEAYPIITKAEAAVPAGGQTGLFLPLELSVKNYRSYGEETLSFQDIYFAMVNGKNGSGKSSLFMDAIVDCLYEQPREGELTGWIKTGERSGNISFAFRLGNDTWRVTRTRQKSGKATLALSKLLEENNINPEQWQDHSCTKLVDTQEKIVQLLGMDADTFQSCVLIMQDQYGRFMEAKPEDRMSVLASLLGLGIYEELEKETKVNLTDVNRELRQVKEEIGQLEQEVSCIQDIEDSKNQTNHDLCGIKALLEYLKNDHDETSTKVAQLKSIEVERDRLKQNTEEKISLIQAKNVKLDELAGNVLKTKQFLSKENELNEKHIELQEVKANLAAMDSKVKLHQEKRTQLSKHITELLELNSEKNKVEKDIQSIQQRLLRYDMLVSDIAAGEGLEEEFKQYEKKLERYREVHEKISHLGLEIINIDTKINYCVEQTKMLEQSGCIDIEQASCKFLKTAKEAKVQLKSLEVEKSQLEAEQKTLIDNAFDYDYDQLTYEGLKKRLEDHRSKSQQLIALDGDKKLLDLYINRLSEIVFRIEATSNDKQSIEAELNLLQQEIDGYDALKAKVSELEKSEQQWLKIPAGKQYLETILPQIEELAVEIKQLEKDIENQKNKIYELERQLTDGEKHIKTLEEIKIQINKNETIAFNLSMQLGSLEEKLIVLLEKKKTLQERQETIKLIASKVNRLQILSVAFSQDGIPHQIIRDIIPELEAAANEILTQMTGGRMRLEFRTERTLKSNKAKEIATLDIVIIDVDHGELPYLSMSGGQKVRAALAASFALAIIKASRVGLQLGMMFVDEPPFLDDEGVEAYCGALEVIHNKYPDMRIVAISHDENMKSAFPQQIYIEVTETGSKIRR